MTGLVPRVDAHLHVWDLASSDYAWLTPTAGPLHRSFLPEQAWGELQSCGVDWAVLVQAEDSERDTEAMLAAADAHSWVVGVVGWVDLEQPVLAADQLDRWQSQPAFCGVRQLVHDDPRDHVLELPQVRQTLATVARRGLPLDVPDAWPRHLAAISDLAAALPELRIVVDHLGKPPVDGTQWPDWHAALAAVARHPSTAAKVSGLQVPGRVSTVTALRPAWEAALELFGPERLMWGSDWPMTVLTDGYAGTWEVVSALVEELSAHEQARLLGGTAAEVYRLTLPTSGSSRDQNVSGT